MKRSEFRAALAARLNLSEDEARQVVAGFTETLAAALVDGEKVSLDGVGVFRVKRRAPRVVRHPTTGEEAALAASSLVVFDPAPKLRAQLAQPQTPKPRAR